VVDEPVGIDLTAPEQSVTPALSTVLATPGSDPDITIERPTEPRPPGAHRKPKPGKTPKPPKAPKPPKLQKQPQAAGAVKGSVAAADISGVDDTLGAPGSTGAVGLSGSADPAAPETLAAEGIKPAKGAKPTRPFWVEAVVLLVIAAAIAVGVHSFLFQAFFIPSGSMENTLLKGDRVIVNRLSYKVGHVQRGQIVVFSGVDSWTPEGSISQPSNPVLREFSKVGSYLGFAPSGEQDFIKRVIGIPGDHVVCCNTQGQITVNGVALSESSYLYPGNVPSTQKFNIKVPSGRLWVMGDHRAVSYDSRGHMGDPGGGTIPESGVLGRAFVIIWPPSRWGFLNIPATFEQPQLNASNAASGGSTAALTAAMDNGTPIQTAGSALPLGVGFLGAIPITLLQRTVRRRLKSRRARRNA
jgi:signal peptidase I